MKKRISVVINIIFGLSIFFFIAVSFAIKQKAKESMQHDQYNFVVLEEDREISALYTDGERVYVGTDKGVFVYDAASANPLYSIDDISLIYTAGMSRSVDGSLWIGHEEGLTCIYPDGIETKYMYPMIPKGRVNTVICNDEEVWCGTYNGAAFLTLADGRWQVKNTFTSEDGLICDSVNTMLTVDNGLLLGSYLDVDNGGITFLHHDGTKQHISVADGLPHPYITSLISISDDIVLAGCGYMDSGGLAVLHYDPDKKGYVVANVYTKEDGLPGEKIRALYSDDDYTIITTEYDGVEIVRSQNGVIPELNAGLYLRDTDGLSDNEVKCVVRANDVYWLGAKYGVTLIPVVFLDENYEE